MTDGQTGDDAGADARAGTATGDADTAIRTGDSSDAFAALASETRLGVLRALLDDEERPVVRTFSDLHEASDEETSAGFAYHLRQLTGRYVEQTDAGYRLTYAGRKAARAVAADTFTARVDHGPVPVADDCPLCGAAGLAADGEDNHLTVGCSACGREVLSLPYPPGGHRTQSDLLAAFDRYHRHRIALMADGGCPECGGAVETTAERVDDPRPGTAGDGADTTGGDRTDHGAGTVQARLACVSCGYRLRVPVTLLAREHSAAVALYHEHGVDIRKRPVWNVGPEWRETVVSSDPLAVRVSTRVGGEELALFVGPDGSVVHAERRGAADEDGEGRGTERAESHPEHGTTASA